MNNVSKRRDRLIIGTLLLLVIVAFTVSVGSGTVSIAPDQTVAVLLSKIGINTGIEVPSLKAATLWNIRVPRVFMAFVVGAALAVSGTSLQGVFHNPLAEPSLLGISGGAVVFAMVATVIRTQFATIAAGTWIMPLGGFLGALLVSLGLYTFFRRLPKRDAASFLLTGVIVNVILGAMITLLPRLFRESGLGSDTTFWTMGGFGGTLWPSVYYAAPISIAAAVLLWRLAPKLNVMALGDTNAQYLGVDTHTVRLQIILLVALVTGTVVAFAGVIAFVGLVVPHALRLVMGPDHRTLIPAGALGGAILVGAADLFARTLISPSELPVGIFTTLVGGPLFFWLFYRERSQGRWV